MKIENGKIIECTENELFEYYLRRGISNCGIQFYQYMQSCKLNGTKIIEEENDGIQAET